MLKNYVARHLQAALQSLGKLSHAPTASLMTCLVMGISLAFPTILFVTLKNAEKMHGSFQQATQLTLYLKPNLSDQDVATFTQTLNKMPTIKSTRAISPTQGLHELTQQAGFAQPLDALTENPLPWAVVILPAPLSPLALEQLAQHLQALPPVENVQLDMLWVKRLALLVTLLHRFTYAFTLFLGLAVLLIVNNSIRTATERHRKEIEITQLIGGTAAFIRRPFLYTGMIYGLLAGIFAWGLVTALVFILQEPARHLAELYSSQFSLYGLNILNTGILLASSIGLGFLGSWIAVARHLRNAS